MLCPICGFAQPGEAGSCPSCGRVFSKAAFVAPRPPRLSLGVVRLVVYALLGFGVVRYFGSLCSSYLDAEQTRLESLLLYQALQHKKAVQEVMNE